MNSVGSVAEWSGDRTQTTSPPQDSPFIEEILADGSVSVAEMERAYLGFVACLREGGAFGTFAFDLSVGPGISSNISVAGDTDGTLTNQVLARCQGTYVGDLEHVYERDHPITATQEETVRVRLLACLLNVASREMAEVPPDETYQRLVEIANELAANSESPLTAVGASECVLSSHRGPWQPIEE